MAKTKFAVKSMVADELTTVRSEIKTLQARAKFLLEIVKDERAAAKNTMVSIRAAKVAKLEEKRAERIQKLEAKLLALKSPKVGIAAKKAARKPSKVQITKVAQMISAAEAFLYDIDYLINDQAESVERTAFIMGCSEAMVLDAIQILRDAFMETEQQPHPGKGQAHSITVTSPPKDSPQDTIRWPLKPDKNLRWPTNTNCPFTIENRPRIFFLVKNT